MNALQAVQRGDIISLMKHVKVIIALGVLVMVIPFSGLPGSWRDILFVIAGALIAVLAFRLLPIRKNAGDGPESKSGPISKKDTQEEENHG